MPPEGGGKGPIKPMRKPVAFTAVVSLEKADHKRPYIEPR